MCIRQRLLNVCQVLKATLTKIKKLQLDLQDFLFVKEKVKDDRWPKSILTLTSKTKLTSVSLLVLLFFYFRQVKFTPAD